MKTKLQLSFLLVGLLAIVLTGFLAFVNARNTIERITVERLTAIRETKRRQVESYFDHVRTQVILLSAQPMAADVLEELAAAGAGRSRTLPKFREVLREYRQRFGYEDLYLVSAADGQIVCSAAEFQDEGLKVDDLKLAQTGLASSVRRALAADSPSFAFLADFSPYPFPEPAPAAFVASPVQAGPDRLGALAIRISSKPINDVMTSGNHWEEEGLGESGETYIVGPDFRLRTDSRFFVQQADEYFKRLVRAGLDTSAAPSMRRQGSSILLQEVRTQSTIDALAGRTATKIISDYRGVAVLSSYSPLAVADMQWVIVSEIDLSEAFRGIFVLRERLILIGLVVLLASVFAGFVISRTISNPIMNLARAAESFGAGSPTARVEPESGDEIGDLAKSFNAMADRIAHDTDLLRAEIADRTAAESELNISRERLRRLSAHLQTAREEERKALAREIHDELGQALTTLKLNLILLRDHPNPLDGAGKEPIGNLVSIVDATIKSIKRMITALRPQVLDDLGLSAALEWQTTEFEQRTGIPCNLHMEPPAMEIDPTRSTAVFRIVQEALTNIARHAKAHSVSVLLVHSPDMLTLTVRDDGIGITGTQADGLRSFGLIGIRERAAYWGGHAEIHGEPGAGTSVTVHIPNNDTQRQ